MAKKIAPKQALADEIRIFGGEEVDDIRTNPDVFQTIDQLSNWLDRELEGLERRFRGFVTLNSQRREIGGRR